MARFLSLKIAAIAVTVFVAGAAQAHPKLVSASPAADSVVAKPAKIELHFSEKLVPAFSGVDLVMTGMPGMSGHAPMKVKDLPAIVGADGKSLVATPKAPLPAGDYKLSWHAVAGDSHRIEGSYAFKVK